MQSSRARGNRDVNEILMRILIWGSGTSCVGLVFLFRSVFSAAVCLALSLILLFFCLQKVNANILPSSFQTAYLTAAGILSAIAGKRFFDCWKFSGTIAALAQKIGRNNVRLTMLLTLIGCIAAIPFLAYISVCMCQYLRGRYGREMEKYGRHLKGYSWSKFAVILSAIYLVALFPLLRANFNYIDDNGRVFSGYAGWENFSRYLSNFLSGFIHCGSYLTDISPFPQMIAILVLVSASAVVIRVFKGNGYRASLWDIAAVIPLGLSPYFLENISYKMDSPYMAISVLASVIPLLFCNKNRLAYIAAAFFCMLAVCMTYQAASGIFPMAVILLAFQKWCKKEDRIREILIFIFDSAVAYAAALGIFSKFLMTKVDTYVSNEIASVPVMISNYRRYLSLVKSDFHRIWIFFILFLVVWYIVMSIYNSKQNKAATCILSAIVTAAAALLSFGIYPALAAPLTAPRAMYGVGAFIAFMGVGNIAKKDRQIPLRAITVVLAWIFVTFASAYGNALAAQQEYENFRIEEVINDLTDIKEFYNEGEKKVVQVNGRAGLAPSVRRTADEYEILKRLIPIQFCERWAWGLYRFSNYYGLNEVITCDTGHYLEEDYSGWPVLQESFYHTVYYKDNWFVIQLK